MMICEAGAIVVVPFPFTDRNSQKGRPALVLSTEAFNREHEHVLLAMITTAKHSHWKSDYEIFGLFSAGLPVPSVVRMKIFTLDNRLILKRIGALHENDFKQVQKSLKDICGLL